MLRWSIDESTRVVVIVITANFLLPPSQEFSPLPLHFLLSHLLLQLLSLSLSLPPIRGKQKPLRRVFQMFTERERRSRRTSVGHPGLGPLLCFHCIISVHNKHIISPSRPFRVIIRLVTSSRPLHIGHRLLMTLSRKIHTRDRLWVSGYTGLFLKKAFILKARWFFWLFCQIHDMKACSLNPGTTRPSWNCG